MNRKKEFFLVLIKEISIGANKLSYSLAIYGDTNSKECLLMFSLVVRMSAFLFA